MRTPVAANYNARNVMKKVAIIPMVLGVAMGAVAIKLGLDFVQEAKASGGQKVSVVVAMVDIASTSEIDETMLKVIETPTSPLLGEDSYASVKDLVGRVALTSIPPGAVVREALLAPKGTPSGLVVRIPPGFRAVSVKINEVTGVAYQIPVTYKGPETHRKETFSRIILQRVEVIAVGRMLAAGGQSSSKSKAAKSVTLSVKDSDVPKLHLAETRGTVTLAMRGPNDKLTADEGRSSESELFGLNNGHSKEPEPEPKRAIAEIISLPVVQPHRVTIVNGQAPPMIVTFESSTSMHVTGTKSMGKAKTGSKGLKLPSGV